MSNNKVRDLLLDGKHEEVISTFSLSSPLEVFCAISSYISLGKYAEAIELLTNQKEALFKDNPLRTMKTNFSIRFALKQFDEAYEDAEYFANLPYVSQEVEEYLRELPKMIRSEERVSHGKPALEEDEILSVLTKSNDEMELLGVLNSIHSVDISPYLKEIEDLCGKDGISDNVKTYAFMLLSSHDDPHIILLKKRGKEYRVAPNKVGVPFAMGSYQYLRKQISSYQKDSSLAEIAGELLDQYALALYPEAFVQKGEEDSLLQGLLCLASRYLGKIEEESKEGKLLADFIASIIEGNK